MENIITKLEKIYKLLADNLPFDATACECRGILNSIMDKYYEEQNGPQDDDEQDYSYFDIDHYKEHPEQCNDITDSITVCEHCSAYISESLPHECSEMYSDDYGQAAYDAHMEDMKEQAIEIGGKREILDSSHYDRLVSEGYSFTNNADNIEDYLKRYDCITVNHLTKRGCIDAYGNFACEHPEFMLLD